MKCIDCPVYKFDGKNFKCPAVPYHDFNNEGMFADPKQPKEAKVCQYARMHLRSLAERAQILEAKYKRMNDTLESYQRALDVALNVPEWKRTLEEHIKVAHILIGRVIAEQVACEKERRELSEQLKKLEAL